MPLSGGTPPDIISENVRTLMNQGMSQEEATARAFAFANKPQLPTDPPMTSKTRLILPSEVSAMRAQRRRKPVVPTVREEKPSPLQQAVANFKTFVGGGK